MERITTLFLTIFLSFFSLLSQDLSAASGFFGGANDVAYIIYDTGTGNTFTDAGNTPSTTPIDLGTVSTLFLNGGEAKTFKNGTDDITEVRLMYRIYETGSPSGTFSPIQLFFLENCNVGTGSFPSGGGCGVGDQKWQTTAQELNVLTSLPQDVNHTLEFYFEADFTFTDAGGGSGTHFYSNGGTNYALTFTTAVGVPTLSQWGLIILALLLMTFGTLYISQEKSIA